MCDITVSRARREDAPLIARAIMMAVGGEICLGLAGERHTLADVEALFTELASLEDSQYSYRNAIVALTADGEVAGVCIAYDGARLHSLRKRFFEAALRRLDLDFTSGRVVDECSADEYYIDTIAVWPQYRGKGVATKLLHAELAKAEELGKPAGLLVDKDNTKAETLYRGLGFMSAGERPFAGVVMTHLLHPLEIQ